MLIRKKQNPHPGLEVHYSRDTLTCKSVALSSIDAEAEGHFHHQTASLPPAISCHKSPNDPLAQTVGGSRATGAAQGCSGTQPTLGPPSVGLPGQGDEPRRVCWEAGVPPGPAVTGGCSHSGSAFKSRAVLNGESTVPRANSSE